jgi:hypothetical protein
MTETAPTQGHTEWSKLDGQCPGEGSVEQQARGSCAENITGDFKFAKKCWIAHLPCSVICNHVRRVGLTGVLYHEY